MQREVEVDVALRVPRQHGGDHEVGLVDRDQGGYFVVRYSGLDCSYKVVVVSGKRQNFA